MTSDDVTPDIAVEQYLESRHDIQPSTRSNHKYRLNYFLEWAEEAGIHALSELDGFDLERYKNWRLDETECALVTLEQHLQTLRVFLTWCHKTDVIDTDLSDKVIVPNLSAKERARDIAISHERAQQIIEYLSEFHFASRMHVVFHTLYHCGMRRSGLHALDIDDWHPDKRYLTLRNRPEQGTRLKLGDEGERNVSVSDGTLASALSAWINERRPDVTDEHGREPLIASKHGRLYAQSLTKIVYKVTRPCFFSDNCPVGREIADCEATNYQQASKCPESVSAHPIRRSAITHHLSEDVPKEIVSERCSVSAEVLDTHYDARSIEQRRQNRERYLDEV